MGLGGGVILTHVPQDCKDESQWSAISYASRPLSDVESHYSQATKTDDFLQRAAGIIRNGNWYTNKKNDQSTALTHIKDELTVSSDNDVIMRGHQIVIPSSLQQSCQPGA